MQVAIEKVETLDELKKLIRDLRVENGANDDEIADALEIRKVKPGNWTAFRVSCLVRGFKIYKKWGRKTAAEEAARYGQKSKSNETSKRSRQRKRSRRRADRSKMDLSGAEMLS